MMIFTNFFAKHISIMLFHSCFTPGMSKVKFGKEEGTSTDFVGKRKALLERCSQLLLYMFKISFCSKFSNQFNFDFSLLYII